MMTGTDGSDNQPRRRPRRAAAGSDGASEATPRRFGQAEIDGLIPVLGETPPRPRTGPFATVEELAELLTSASIVEPVYAHAFAPAAPMARLSAQRDSLALLDATRALNDAEARGNFRIPGTGVELIPFAQCRKCKTQHSQGDLDRYYRSPPPDNRLGRREQMREDTRFRCKKCRAIFLPTLVVVDGRPVTEFQYLCRIQTAHAIERYLWESTGRPVLTRNPASVMRRAGQQAIANDVCLGDLRARPTLIANMLQYTPPQFVRSLITGANLQRPEPLYGAWFPTRTAAG